MWNWVPQIYICSLKGKERYCRDKAKKYGMSNVTVNSPEKLEVISTDSRFGSKDLSCTANHLTVYKDAIKKYPFIMVLEDDFEIFPNRDLDRGIKEIRTFINTNNDWDLLYLGHLPWSMKSFGRPYSILPCRSWCTHAFLISGKYMKKLQKDTPYTIAREGYERAPVKNSGIFTRGGIDTFFMTDTNKSYAIYPQLFYQTSQVLHPFGPLLFERLCWLTGDSYPLLIIACTGIFIIGIWLFIKIKLI